MGIAVGESRRVSIGEIASNELRRDSGGEEGRSAIQKRVDGSPRGVRSSEQVRHPPPDKAREATSSSPMCGAASKSCDGIARSEEGMGADLGIAEKGCNLGSLSRDEEGNLIWGDTGGAHQFFSH